MNEFEECNEELGSDIDQLKQQMEQILKILQALQMKASERTQAQPITLHLNRPGQYVDPAQAHLYGLSPNYIPLIAHNKTHSANGWGSDPD